MHWTVTMLGPPNTPYEGGIFLLGFTFPPKYPFSPPDVIFKTPIYHPRIRQDGQMIYHDILYDMWAATKGVLDILREIHSMLINPHPYDPLESDIARQLEDCPEAFNQTARQWTRRHAT
jgi:ubiquitin-conjugating enzyme E2 D/E